MTRHETPPDQKGGSGQWLKSNLSALGSATVIAVYAAGFIHTKAAAASLSEEPVRRVQTAVLAPPSENPAAQPATVRAAVIPATAAPTAPVASPKPAPVSADAQPAVSASRKTAEEPAATRAAAAPTPASTPTKTVATSQPSAAPLAAAKVAAAKIPAATVAANVPAPILSVPVAAPIKTPTATPTAPTQTPAPTPKPTPAPTTAPAAAVAAATTDSTASPAHAGFKDGTYIGYGRSNHGDIEATVDVVDGKIVDSYISKCLTEYSCSWIVALPPQVSQRQSAEVDIVSGATASSNAFYAAVRQALSKAK